MGTTDPLHDAIAVPGPHRVRVTIGGQLVADSARPVLLREEGLPVRYYLPPEDVDLALFEASGTRTTCPRKGEASYWTSRTASGPHQDVAWAYQEPPDSFSAIKGFLAFDDTAAQVSVRSGDASEGAESAEGRL